MANLKIYEVFYLDNETRLSSYLRVIAHNYKEALCNARMVLRNMNQWSYDNTDSNNRRRFSLLAVRFYMIDDCGL